MSHNIESIAWTNEQPWHGLGTKVASTLTPEQMLKAADLDWKITKEPLQTRSGTPVEDFYALKRSSDNSILDIVGSQYTPVQNRQAFKFFNDFVKAGKAKMDTAGSLKNGRMVWGLASLGNSFTLPGKDKVDGYLLVASPHEQGKSLRIQFTAVRVVCNNTLTMALNSSKLEEVFKHAHRKEFTDDMIKLAKETLGIANEQFDEFATLSSKLAKKKVSRPTQLQFLKDVFYPAYDEPIIQVEKMNKPFSYALAALEHSPGHDMLSAENTAWGLLNAVTYTTDHLLARTADARLNKAWFGRTATLKANAFKLAGEL